MGHLESNKGEEYPRSKTEGFVVQRLKDETLIYNIKTNKAICLNETSAIVWEMCDGKKSVPKIAKKISKKLKKPVAEDLVWFAIDQLSEEGLLENDVVMIEHFAGLSMREMIRKVGFASVIALPIVSSIVAPRATTAQSCLAPNTPLMFPFPNPSTQPDNPTCVTFCFLAGLGNPESSCCSGIGESTFVRFSSGNCECNGYSCR